MKKLVDGIEIETTADDVNYTVPVAAAKTWTPLEFMELLSFEERVAIRELAKTDLMAEDWLDLLKASTLVRADDVRTTAGLDYMVLKGVLTRQRANEILA